MTTRLYLPASGTPPLASLGINANWELTNGLVRLPCFTAKQNTALATSTRTWPATSTQQWCWWQFQSDILAEAYGWLTTDTVSMVIGKCAETTTNGDTHLAYVVRVVSGDGATVRGVIGLYHATSTEYPLIASAATRIHSARVNGATAFSSQVGDRIIVEIGLHGVTPAAQNIQMRIGDPSATADFALTAGLTTDLVPWIQLSRTVTFGQPPIQGSLSATLGALTLVGTSLLPIVGGASPSLGALAVAASAELEIAGTLARALGDATLSAQATVLSPIEGGLDVTLGGLSLVADGVLPIGGAGAVSLETLTLQAEGVLPITATALPTFAELTLEASGTLGAEAIVGSLVAQLDALSLLGSGTIEIAGSLIALLDDVFLAGEAGILVPNWPGSAVAGVSRSDFASGFALIGTAEGAAEAAAAQGSVGAGTAEAGMARPGSAQGTVTT